MQVLNPNNVKIYNLSSGKSLPEWLSDRRSRALQKSDPEIGKRIELIQDFQMPVCSTCVRPSPDGQYVLAAGVYKPRIRCYDVAQLSMKFERCLDSEVVKFDILSDDYSKLILLQSDRYIEFHSQHGRYYRTRIPKYGRDMAYHKPSCDLYCVGASTEIYRLNLEIGRFMRSLKSNTNETLCCEINPSNYLLTCGTIDGTVECWDPRTRQRVSELDCTRNSLMQEAELDGLPSVCSMKYIDALTLAVGTRTGQILLYDVRSDKPLMMKDHNFGLPIHSIQYHASQNTVLSCDPRIVKLWDKNTGKAFTSIEPGEKLTDLCLLPDTGMLFMANEAPKMQVFYIPTLGPAPKWCSFLDSLTEELEENPAPSVYDDYKFVTRTELEKLGLTHLIGTTLLKGYMHGYFMDIRLYRKAMSIAEPFAYQDYRRRKIREKIEEERANRVKLHKLPKVNRQLAEKLLQQEDDVMEQPVKKKNKKAMTNLLKDDRFSKMFSDSNFQVDTESEDYRMLNPLVSKLDKAHQKRQQKNNQDSVDNEELAGDFNEDSDDSSDDDREWTKQVKEQHRLLKRDQSKKRYDPPSVDIEHGVNRPVINKNKTGGNTTTGVKFVEFGETSKANKKEEKLKKRSFSERVKLEEDTVGVIKSGSSIGNMEMSFTMTKNKHEKKRRIEAERHHAERKKLRRSAGGITKAKHKPGGTWRK